MGMRKFRLRELGPKRPFFFWALRAAYRASRRAFCSSFQRFLGRDTFLMLAFGLRLGLDFGLLAAFFFLQALLFRLDRGQALFLGALLGALLAGGGDRRALAERASKLILAASARAFALASISARALAARIDAIVVLGFFEAGHFCDEVFQVSMMRRLGASGRLLPSTSSTRGCQLLASASSMRA